MSLKKREEDGQMPGEEPFGGFQVRSVARNAVSYSLTIFAHVVSKM